MPALIDVSSDAAPRLVRWWALAMSAVVVTLGLVTAQSGSRGDLKPKTPAAVDEIPELKEVRAKANDLFRAGEYLSAIQLYQEGYEEAKRRGVPRTAVRLLNNLGGAQYRIFR